MNANPVKRLDRNAWLSEAMEVLRESGVDHVKVEPLAKRLGVTKGSFYWHFKDRPDLLRALPEYWVESQTEPVLAHAESAGRTPVEIKVIHDQAAMPIYRLVRVPPATD